MILTKRKDFFYQAAAVIVLLFLVFSCSSAPKEVQLLNNGEKKRVSFTLERSVKVTGQVLKLEMKQLLPADIDYRQKVVSLTFDPEPDDIFSDGDNKGALFFFVNPPDEFILKIKVELDVYRYDFETAKASKTFVSSNSSPEKYLSDEKKIESKDSLIVNYAKQIGGETEEEILKNIFEFVTGHLEYDVTRKTAWIGAKEALLKNSGVCSDYADLFVALARAKGIPARKLSGYTIKKGTVSEGHAWAEAYLKEYGWVAFDPTWADGEESVATFEYLPNMYITLDMKNDGRFNYRWWSYGGRVKSGQESFTIHNIKIENTIDSKAKSLVKTEFFKDVMVKKELERYTSRFTVMAEKSEFPEEIKKAMKDIAKLSFIDRPLNENERTQLVQEMDELKKQVDVLKMKYNSRIERFLKFGRVRIEIEDGVYGQKKNTEVIGAK
ncbi:MAG TPA: transglutaminase domain-containing protein [bacterium]|nr:transglutaminase domain-containing protein [bacterium]